MNTLSLFILEVVICLGISLGLILVLTPLLREVLVETCGTQKRAAFWVTFTQLMLVMSPLLIVVFFAPTNPHLQINIAREVQQTLFRALLGDFIALASIGRVIWRSVSNADKEHALVADAEV